MIGILYCGVIAVWAVITFALGIKLPNLLDIERDGNFSKQAREN